MDAPLSYMSPMMTEELVVTRGIASVSLAPEAIGGHVSTRTSRGDFTSDEFGVSGMIGTRYSENGDISTTAARLTLANDRHRVSAIAEFDDGDDIETPKGDIVPTRIDRDRGGFYGIVEFVPIVRNGNGYRKLAEVELSVTWRPGGSGQAREPIIISKEQRWWPFSAPAHRPGRACR